MNKRSTLKQILVLIGLSLSANLMAQDAHVFPTFTNVTPAGAPQTFRGNGAWADYNNDGAMDLIYVGRDIADGWATHVVLLSNGTNGLEVKQDLGIPAAGVCNAVFTWIDYNNDGNLDLLYIGTTNNETSSAPEDVFAFLFKNTGSAGGYAFEQVENPGILGYYFEQEGNYGSLVSVGDYNNDGYADFVVSGKRGDARFTDLYKNNGGDGTFTAQEKMVDGFFSFDGMSSGSVAFGDYNNDGKLDVLATGWNDNEGDALVKLYKNIGGGQFEDAYIEDVAKGTQKGQIGWFDINSDGKLDFMLTGERMDGGWPKMADIYLNKGAEGFALAADTYIDPLKNSGFDVADMDADGKLDIIMAGEGNTQHTWIYLNNGNVSFDAQNDLMGAVRSGAVISMADYNNDGFLDGFTTGYGDASLFQVWKNNGEGKANTAPTAPSNLKSSYADGKMTFTWDAGTDTESPAASLKYNVFVKVGDKTAMLVPANATKGFVKVSDITNAVISKSYTLEIADGEYEWGVQTIDQAKKGSAFATAKTQKSGTDAVNTISKLNVNAFSRAGQIYVSLDNEPATVTVISLSGKQIVKEVKAASGAISGNLNKGIYLVKISTAKGEKVSKVAVY